MPLVRISVPDHLPAAQVVALADAVQDALVNACNIPPNDRFQLISRFPAEAMIIDPTFPNVERSAEASIVEVTLIAGQSDDRKRRLYHRIVSSAVTAGFRPDDVLIALTENARIDWSPGRGAAYEGHPAGNP
jgi:phenylpyruvate tautomerase PptA (4-oxalocrotonate tautomerase family)